MLELKHPKARDAPPSEAINAWLSLDGIPKNQAKIPNKITVKKQERQAMLEKSSFLNDARDKTFFVTFPSKSEKTKTPIKLNTADKITACLKLKAFEVTTEKTEFGASVQPFTNTTKIERKRAKALKKDKETISTSLEFQFEMANYLFLHKIYLSGGVIMILEKEYQFNLCNPPELIEGMMGIYWGENGNETRILSESDSNWYCYSKTINK